MPSAPMGRLTRKIQCHDSRSTSSPPSGGPSSGPTSAGMASAAMLRSRVSGVDQRNSSTWPTGAISAPAAPWARRARDSCSSEVDAAQASEASMNRPMAASSTRRGPKRSATQPLTGTNSATASRYSDTTRFMRTAASPKSAAICGSAVSTAVLSSSSMNSAAPVIIGTRRPFCLARFIAGHRRQAWPGCGYSAPAAPGTA
jgi:hypothetical protein